MNLIRLLKVTNKKIEKSIELDVIIGESVTDLEYK